MHQIKKQDNMYDTIYDTLRRLQHMHFLSHNCFESWDDVMVRVGFFRTNCAKQREISRNNVMYSHFFFILMRSALNEHSF